LEEEGWDSLDPDDDPPEADDFDELE